MSIARLAAATLLLWVAACASGPGETGERLEIPGLERPVALPAGWSRVEGPTEYTPETLFEYINGEARSYHAYGFAGLFHLRAAGAEEDDVEFELDVYDMGSELGAYGIYSVSRPREAEPRPWGSDGYVHGAVAAAWKGSYYVRAEITRGPPNAAEAAGLAVRDAVDAVGREPSKPAILSAIPRAGLVANTEHYVARDLMGHAFLPGGMIARYRIDGAEAVLFLSDLGSAEAARAALLQLRDYEAEDGRVLGEENGVGEEGFRAEDPGLGPGLVVRQQRFLAGVWGAPSRDAALELLRALVSNLQAGDG